jgi:hypothetical protein
MNAPNPCRGEQHRIRSMLIEPAIDGRLVAQIDRIAPDRKNPTFFLRQPAHQRRSDHATMPGDEYASSVERKEGHR